MREVPWVLASGMTYRQKHTFPVSKDNKSIISEYWERSGGGGMSMIVASVIACCDYIKVTMRKPGNVIVDSVRLKRVTSVVASGASPVTTGSAIDVSILLIILLLHI
jgi:hypothetical protein